MGGKRNICMGILAHVDAGKTTLSEAILYNAGKLRKLGRVDKRDAFLDTYTLEKERGITIFSKQALFEYNDCAFTLLDTPGHVDFSPEMERALSVLDLCVLVISGPDGIQAHTRTLWKLLKAYDVPTFIFVNKMDRDICNKEEIAESLRQNLDEGCIDISSIILSEKSEDKGKTPEDIFENISFLDEELLASYLEKGMISDSEISDLIGERKLFPVFFGSALKNQGVDSLLTGITKLFPEFNYEDEFAARIFKISRDAGGKRLTYLKITGGSLKIKDKIDYCVLSDEAVNTESGSGAEENNDNEELFETCSEKVNEIRIYDGAGFITADTAFAGMVVAVTGLSRTTPGMSLGAEEMGRESLLTPVLSYRIDERDESKLKAMLPKLKRLEEEEPQLHVIWNREVKELQIRVMGKIQLEILKSRYLELFGEKIEFDKGSILYKETVTAPVLGVGHYEPLRHYAEVQLVIEPERTGYGIGFESVCSVNELERNWQRLIATHVMERQHKGTLTGAPLTDCKITLVAGKSHIKHTEGGDFRQATYRAIRQALMRARATGKMCLLEPYYEMTMEVPLNCIGRAMNDIDMRSGRITGQYENHDTAILTAVAPVSTIQDYAAVLVDYTAGLGTVYNSFYGYGPCHNSEEVQTAFMYDPDGDMRNPSYSVFCAHGAGFSVAWNEVDSYKHIQCDIGFGENSWNLKSKRIVGEKNTEELLEELKGKLSGVNGYREDEIMPKEERFVSVEEVDSIINRASFANRKQTVKNPYRKHKQEASTFKNIKNNENRTNSGGNNERRTGEKSGYPARSGDNLQGKEKYLLVDGYNIIFTWKELAELAKVNIDSARDRLNDILMNYQAFKKCRLIVVYDAYRVSGHPTEYFPLNNIMVVFTKEAETADRFIERFAHDNAKLYDVVVATSDGLEQIIIRGQGAALMTANDLLDDVKHYNENSRDITERKVAKPTTVLRDVLPEIEN